ncbi:folate/biopterin family MFS transporter [Aphanothece hegewaldii CCALA 016]|uniref:Folate/biopterin family MFS transporter n=1 Tax=Aphanothece hegewaldii CCALA 016 TaxID=2107694 RepID=A0A2T1LVQ3_9CHRO|nr:folate/biopterin family MFS transporter [Aphanothece hegewaldii]PSF35699.1 folate/biopterin family MFS transporter [Aphanothece hegewaldii CCALA 016]
MALSAIGTAQIKQAIKKDFLFGNKPTPELTAILGVYFVQGILGLARLAVSFFLKDELGLSPAQMGALVGVAAIPWVIKPVFGFLSDGFPIFGYRRRSYLILSGILGSTAWIALATIVHNTLQATAAILISSLSVAVSDVIVDSIVVERARKESLGQAGSLQSLTWGVSALGGLITAYLSGLLLAHFTTRTVFAITAIFPLVVCGLAWLIVETKITSRTTDETESSDKITINQQIRQLWRAITQKSILLPMIFIFLWQATPSADSAFFFFTTNELGFEPEFLGRVRLVTSFASLIGIWVYQRFLKTISFRLILGWSTVISAILGMTTLLLVTHTNRSLGIDDHWFSLGDSLILTVMGQIAFLPVLVLSARLCPPGIEASLFALLMSTWNLSGLLSQELGALLTHWLGVTETNFDRLWLLVIITNVSTLLPLPLIGWLPAGDPQQLENSQKASLPPTELIEHHVTGSMMETPFIPELVPGFIGEKSEQSRQS